MLNRVASAYEKSDKEDLLEIIEARCAPGELRNLAGTMLRLADALDQNWSSAASSSYSWLSEARRIERDAFNLAIQARKELERRSRRRAHIPTEFLGEPAWDMLLELFCQFAGGAKVSVKSLSYVSGVPSTTALRVIERLVEAGLVTRSRSHADGRVVLLELTRDGVVAVGRALRQLSKMS